MNCFGKHPGRRCGCVGASRFRSRAGCYLYGRIRRTDFLPVGEPQDDEVTERGTESESADEDDGPKFTVRNGLIGRMRGFDDEDSASDESDYEKPVRWAHRAEMTSIKMEADTYESNQFRRYYWKHS